MKRKIKSQIMMLFSVSLIMTACKKDDVKPEDSNEEELITTVQLKIKESGTNTINTFSWKDVDGVGGNPPVKQDITLSPNKSYEVEVGFLDESKMPAKDITDEVKEEANDHEVFFQSSSSFIAITRTDKDSKNLPLGLQSSWVTGVAASGNVKVILKHKPGTKAAGDGADKGETDIEVTFQVEVK